MIAELFKKLSESSSLPMFIGTSDMIIKTPVYNVESDKDDNSIIATRLKVLEESVCSLIKETKERCVTTLNTLHASYDSSISSETVNSTNKRFPIHEEVSARVPMNKAVNFVPMNNKVNNSTRTDMTYANIVRNTSMENVTTGPSTNEKGPTPNEEWRIVQPTNKETGTMQWRQRLHILSGTASDESGSNSFSADMHLVAYGVAKQITGIQPSHFLQDRGLNVLSCDKV